ncbi:MAG TPA: LptF/LptG family permease, partial [Gemmatales bacterium]|nr:LptF/LptG family permease [Gemmatales bacterium]
LDIIPMLLPGTLPFTVPATVLFAVSVVYGRMAHDNELTAIKSAGLPLRLVLVPALLLGVLLSIGIYLLYREYIPHTHHRLRTTVFVEFERFIYARLKRDLCFNEPKVPLAIWVKDVQGRVLIGPTFKKRDAEGRDEIVGQALEAELEVDLVRGEIIAHLIQGTITKDDSMTYSFARESIPVPLPNHRENRQVRARERSDDEIVERRLVVRQELREALDMLDEVRRQPPEALAETAVPPEVHWRFRIDMLKRELGELNVELAMRPALAAGCLCFVLIGCPVAIWFQRRDYLSNFVTCFLPIVVINYPLMMLAIHLGKDGRLDPEVGVWLGNLVLGTVGLVLLRYVARH